MAEGKEISKRGPADLASSTDYAELLGEVKRRITEARTQAAVAVNQELVRLYWSIGNEIVERREAQEWGAKVVPQLARDLKAEGHKGFSERNLVYMATFAGAWTKDDFAQAAPAQISWEHNKILLDKLSDRETRLWYAEKTLEQGWSSRVLRHQIETQLHLRSGAAVTNFARALPAPDSELAQEIIHDPYSLEFIPSSKVVLERDLELALLDDIQSFLLELGVGFAFVGRQQRLEVEGDEFFLDLLFYHLHLRRYVVIELKIGKFEPEFAGKMHFYLNAVDGQLRGADDRESIGIVLCTERNRQVVEYALRGITTPLGVSTYKLGEEPAELTEEVPEALQEELPDTAQLTAGLQRIVESRGDEIDAAIEADQTPSTE